MADLLSVIIPTYNPNPVNLQKTLSALQNQTLPKAEWEIIIVDNNSASPVSVDLEWHPNYKTVCAPIPGLTNARLKGFEHSKGNIIVMVDDDNILDLNYLAEAKKIINAYERLGAAGGKSIPLFETNPPHWLSQFHGNLALRDPGEKEQIVSWTQEYPHFAPIGAGMVIRKEALTFYLQKKHTISDRKGDSLASGGDNDIVIEILKSGWQAGYFPQLKLQHIIPTGRMRVSYLAKLLNHTNRSWVALLNSHNINPWGEIDKWTVPFRKVKAWFIYKAWKNKVNYIKWQGACGTFDGLADIKEPDAQ